MYGVMGSSVLKAVRWGEVGTPGRLGAAPSQQGGTVTQGELGPPGRLGPLELYPITQ